MASLKRGVIGGKFRRLMIIMWLVFRTTLQLLVQQVELLQLTTLISIYTIKTLESAATVVNDLFISEYLNILNI